MKIDGTFFMHHKTRKLEKLLGSDGVLSLIKLWNYAEQVRPDGVLVNMTEEDIELVVDWNGDAGMFVYTLREIGFLDERDGVFCLHDFTQSPPHRGGMPEGQGGVLPTDPIDETLSDAGRFSVLKRINPELHADLQRLGIRTLSREGFELWKNCGPMELTDAEPVRKVQILEGDGEFDEEEEDPRDEIIDAFDNSEDYYRYLIENNYAIKPVDIDSTGKLDETLLCERMGKDLYGDYVRMLESHRALAA